MKLLSLTLHNFKGVRDLSVEPGGEDLNVFGNNATGKTTIADAYLWLLFGKDSQNRADFEVKTLTSSGHPMHNLDHSVEASFEIEAGKALTLKKVYKEQYVKKRGNVEAEMSGHTTDHFINGVPVQKKEYDAKVASVCSEELLRLLSDPAHFNTHLSWQKRRSLLLEVCGDVTDGDVIASNPLLTPLREILGDYSIEEYRKIAQSRLKEINGQIKDIRPRIDENQRAIDEEVLSAEPKSLDGPTKALNEAQDERQRIESGGQVSELQKQVTEVEAAMNRVKNRLAEQSSKGYTEALGKVNEKDLEVSKARALVSSRESDPGIVTKSLERDMVARDEHRAEYLALQKQTFEWNGTDTCAACGQPLPAEEIGEAKRKAEEQFNLKKAERLAEIKEEGVKLSKNIEQSTNDLEEVKRLLEEAKSNLTHLEGELSTIRAEAESLKTDPPAPETDSDYRGLVQQKTELEARIEELRASNAKALEEANAKVLAAREELRKAEQFNDSIDAAKAKQKRIAELEESHTKLAGEYETLEKNIHLADEFVRTKVGMLTEKINSRFGVARFRLFKEQINGGLTEDCECTVGGVPFGNLNTGMRLNAGLDIIDTLAGHYGFAPPIFVDNAESVTDIRPTTGQQIRLVVSAADKKLRFESAKTAEGALF